MADQPTRATYDIGHHPDIAALRARYDMAAQQPAGQSVSGVAFLSGLYLAISPWVVGIFGRTNLTVSNLITGIAVVLLAAGIASANGRFHSLAWTLPVIGVWTIITPWVLPPHGAGASTIVNNVVTGVVILVTGLACASLGMMSRRHGGHPR
ncbi:SPW repeat protein [Nonomuraea bangladeshensis]|uniref:SPW repeat protein n=1 Tax=Nonomuraea bangladeshensis TaxID=404385 RepID=A0ABV3HKA5_9ACTN